MRQPAQPNRTADRKLREQYRSKNNCRAREKERKNAFLPKIERHKERESKVYFLFIDYFQNFAIICCQSLTGHSG